MVFSGASVSAMIIAAGGRPELGLPPLVVVQVPGVAAQHIERGGLGRLGGRGHGVALKPALVAADAGFDLPKRLAERGVGVGAQTVALQRLARGQGDGAVHPEPVTVPADHHLGVAATLEILSDTDRQLIGNPAPQRLADIDMSA